MLSFRRLLLSHVVLLIIVFTAVSAESQWMKTYGSVEDDKIRSIRKYRSKGYIAAGFTRSFGWGDADLWLVKLTRSGEVDWQKVYGGNDDDSARTVAVTADGGYVVSGVTSSFGNGSRNAWVLKFDSNAELEWEYGYGGKGDDLARYIHQTIDGGYVIAGWTNTFGDDDFDAWIIKLDPEGNVEWSRICGGDGNDYFRTVKQTTDGGYIISGWTESFGTGYIESWIVKLDADGKTEWDKLYGGPYNSFSRYIEQTSDGGYVIAGWTSDYTRKKSDAVVYKIDSAGSVEWSKVFVGGEDDKIRYVQQDSTGDYIAAGWRRSADSGDFDNLMVRLKPDGKLESQVTFGDDGDEMANTILETITGNFLVAGDTSSFGVSGDDSLVIVFNEEDINKSCYFRKDTPLEVDNILFDIRASEMESRSVKVHQDRINSYNVYPGGYSSKELCPD